MEHKVSNSPQVIDVKVFQSRQTLRGRIQVMICPLASATGLRPLTALTSHQQLAAPLRLAAQEPLFQANPIGPRAAHIFPTEQLAAEARKGTVIFRLPRISRPRHCWCGLDYASDPHPIGLRRDQPFPSYHLKYTSWDLERISNASTEIRELFSSPGTKSL